MGILNRLKDVAREQAEMMTRYSNRPVSEVWNCPEAFEFLCSKKWNDLNPTDIPNVRHCGICSENVHWSDNPEEFVANAKLGRCVAVPTQGLHIDGEIGGRVSPEYYENRKKDIEQYKFWRSSWNLILNQDPFFIIFLIRKDYPDALEMFIEIANHFPDEQELLRQAYLLLSKSENRDEFIRYLVDIGQIDEAISIARTLKDSSQVQTVIRIFVQANRFNEALGLFPMLEYSRTKYMLIPHIADKMKESGQIKQALDLCNQHLHYAKKGFQEIEDNIRNRITYLQPLDIFNDLSLEFPGAKDLAVKALELFPDEKSRRDFALHLVKVGHFEQALAIAETLKENSNFLISIVANLSELNKFEEAKQVLFMFESGKVPIHYLNVIVSGMIYLEEFENAIDICEWYIANVGTMLDDSVRQVSSTLNYLNQKIAERDKSKLTN